MTDRTLAIVQAIMIANIPASVALAAVSVTRESL
jgi:hypothetical protein